MLYTLKKNGVAVVNKPSNRAECLVRLEKARAQAAIASWKYSWISGGNDVKMILSNGDVWEMDLYARP